MVATPRWPPVRCAAGLVFLWGAVPREGRHLLSSGGLFARRHMLDTLADWWVRLNHDRTKRHWQSSIFAPEDFSGSTAATPTKRLMGHVAVRQSPAPSHRGAQTGWGDSLGVHSRPVRCVASTVVSALACMTTGGWSDPRTLLGVPSPPLSEGSPLLAVSGSSRGWPACVSSSHTWEARMWSAIAGAQGTGACSRQSPPVPGPHGRQGSHLPYTSVGLLRWQPVRRIP